MARENALAVAALIVVGVVITAYELLSARQAGREDAYQRWLRRTRRMLADAEKDPHIYERRGYFLGPRVIVAKEERPFASRAIDQGELAWAAGRQFVKLPSSPGSPANDPDRTTDG